jgi:hypothetical protein
MSKSGLKQAHNIAHLVLKAQSWAMEKKLVAWTSPSLLSFKMFLQLDFAIIKVVIIVKVLLP